MREIISYQEANLTTMIDVKKKIMDQRSLEQLREEVQIGAQLGKIEMVMMLQVTKSPRYDCIL